MTLYGTDKWIEGPVSPEDREVLWAQVRKIWPHVVAQTGEGQVLPLELLPPDVPEVFLHPDQASFDAWEDHGRTEAHADRMIMVLLGEDIINLTFEYGGRGEKAWVLAQRMLESVRWRRNQITARILTPTQWERAWGVLKTWPYLPLPEYQDWCSRKTWGLWWAVERSSLQCESGVILSDGEDFYLPGVFWVGPEGEGVARELLRQL